MYRFFSILLVVSLLLGLVQTAKAETTTVSPTPHFTILYGQVKMRDGSLAPIGTTVQFITPRGDIAGEYTLEIEGVLKLTMAYGEDNVGTYIPGYRDGEKIEILVDGKKFITNPIVCWKNDWDIHYVEVQEPFFLYMPIISK